MPVFKYKSFDEAEKALWNFNPDDAYFQRILKLFEFARQLNPIRFPRGIFKYRTIEEANKQHDEWVLEHAKKLSRRYTSADHE